MYLKQLPLSDIRTSDSSKLWHNSTQRQSDSLLDSWSNLLYEYPPFVLSFNTYVNTKYRISYEALNFKNYSIIANTHQPDQ